MGAKDFNDFVDESGEQTGLLKPFWMIKWDDDAALLKWLNSNLDKLKEQAVNRHTEQKKNLACYRGIRLPALDTRHRDDQSAETGGKSKSPRVVFNHMPDMVNRHVSRLTKYRGAVAAVPSTEDFQDRVSATVSEEMIEKFWNKIQIDRLLQKHHRRKRIYGEDFIGVFWNPNASSYDLDWLTSVFKDKKLGDPRKMGKGELAKKLREVGSFPKVTVEGEDGKKTTIERPMRRGDAEYRLIMSPNMFLQRKEDAELSEHGTWREWVDVETLRALHPKTADQIGPDKGGMMWDAEACEDVTVGSEVETCHFYHRSTDMLDQGAYVKFTRTAILKKEKPNPYRGWDDRAILPWVRTVDIDVPGVLNGDATVTFGRGPQALYNNLLTSKVRFRHLAAYPKWFYPHNSVKVEQLANASTMVAYKGAVPPVCVTPSAPEGNDSVFMQEVKGDYGQIMNVSELSRGEPPPGVVAAVAMTYLDEKDNEGASISIQDHSVTLSQLALMTIWLMADHYGDDPERLVDLLGKEHADLIDTFDMANLRSIDDLMIQNMTALPQQKAARMQMIIDLKKEWPGLVPEDVAADTLGLADVKRLRSAMTVSIRKADKENWALINAGRALAPIKGEYHLGHYRTHRREMNESVYVTLPTKNREAFEAHIMATEMLMVGVSKRSPVYLTQIVAEFPDFPLFYAGPEVEPMLAAFQQMMLGPKQGPGAGGPPQGGAPMAPPPPGDMPVPPGAEAMMPPAAGMVPGAESMMQGV
jgi:hypothetical protein